MYNSQDSCDNLQGYRYAGLQSAQCCSCGTSYGLYGTASNCNMPCIGNTNEICGGPWSNTIVEILYKGKTWEFVNTVMTTSRLPLFNVCVWTVVAKIDVIAKTGQWPWFITMVVQNQESMGEGAIRQLLVNPSPKSRWRCGKTLAHRVGNPGSNPGGCWLKIIFSDL